MENECCRYTVAFFRHLLLFRTFLLILLLLNVPSLVNHSSANRLYPFVINSNAKSWQFFFSSLLWLFVARLPLQNEYVFVVCLFLFVCWKFVMFWKHSNEVSFREWEREKNRQTLMGANTALSTPWIKEVIKMNIISIKVLLEQERR